MREGKWRVLTGSGVAPELLENIRARRKQTHDSCPAG